MNKSQQLIKSYVVYFKDDSALNGTIFHVRDDCIIIQELDDEDEPDKYVIMKEDAAVDEWNQLIGVIERTGVNVDSLPK